MLKKMAQFFINNSKKVAVVIFAVTILLSYFLPRLRINSDVKIMLPENSENVKAISAIDEKFGGAEYIIALVESENIFTPETLLKVDNISAGLKEITDISDVLSITRMDEIKGTDIGIEIRPITDRVPQTKKEIESFKKYLLGDKRYRGIFVSPDCKHTMIIARLSSAANESAVTRDIENLVKKIDGPDKIYLIGPPYITKTISDYLVSDLRILLPITIAVIVLVLYFSFRSFTGVFLPLLTVALSTIWTMGLMAALKEPMTMITTILPVILFTVGTAYPIHIIDRFNEEISNGLSKKDALIKVISNTGIPVFLAAITTMFGFSSNLFTTLRPIKIFAIAGSFGVALAFLFSLSIVPIFLLWLPAPKIKTGGSVTNRNFSGFLKFLSAGISRQKALIIVSIIVLVTIFALGIPRITTESNFVQYFKEGSGPKIAHHIVDEKFGGGFNFDIVVKGDILSPSVLKQMEKFEEEIKKIPNVNYPNSIVGVLKDSNRAFNENNPRYEVLPQTREAAAQYMLLLSMSNSSFLNSLITPDYQEAHISARVSTVRTKILAQTIREIRKVAKQCFSPEVNVLVAGAPLLLDEIQKLFISCQYSSLIAAFISVFIILTLIYRTSTSGIFAIAPIFVTVVITLGVMGWFKIPLDMANTMTASIAIGIGIDYSCHFFSRYKEERKKGATRSKGVEIAIHSVGAPIFYNAIAVGAGFMVLTFSSFSVLGMFGKLITLTMALSSVGALTVIPILILIKGRIKGNM